MLSRSVEYRTLLDKNLVRIELKLKKKNREKERLNGDTTNEKIKIVLLNRFV